MKPRLICTLFFFSFCICLIYAIVKPPIIDGSFHAISEISWIDEEEDNVVMVAEENYDAKTRKASLILYDDSMNVTFYEDMNLNQTLKYDITGCRFYKISEWIKDQGTPDLKMYEVSENKIIFPLMQFFLGLPKTGPKKGTDRTFETFRDVQAQKWTYQTNNAFKEINITLDIDSFWSVENSIGPSKEDVRPLGFVVRHTSLNKTSSKITKFTHVVNIFYFVQDFFNKEMLQPKQGVFCKNRLLERNFYDFPKFDAISFNMEYILPSFRVFKTVDMWIDNVNKFVQVNLDPEDQSVQPDRGIQNRVLIGSSEQDIIYELDPSNDGNCKIIPMKEIPQDAQTLFDIKRLSQLDITKFFELKKVKYIYIGEAKKRGIPCRLWQGVNRQQILASTITTLWEWCIAERVGKPIMYQPNALPVVSLDVTVIESTFTPAESLFTTGTKLTYNFYNIFYRSTSYINAVAFDITPCFPPELIEPLKFEVHFSSNVTKILGNSTTDADFIDAWRTAIYASSGIHRSSMRITRVRTIISGSKLFVEFHLLGLHPDLPTEVTDNVKLSDAKNSLENYINTGSLTIVWSKNIKQPLILKAVKNSLSRQYDKVKEITDKPTTPELETEPPIKIDTTTPFEITGDIIITKTTPKITGSSVPTSEPGTTTTTTITTVTTSELPPTNLKSVLVGHSKSSMAGLSVGMLFLGIALGAGGTFTFTKYRYLIK